MTRPWPSCTATWSANMRPKVSARASRWPTPGCSLRRNTEPSERRPEIAIGADLIAGFPTEDEAGHAANLSIISELGIVHGHVFPYSPRPGTPAARMPQVDPARVKARAAELRARVAEVRASWLASLAGRPLEVLAERDGTGHARCFARVLLPPGTEPGAVVAVTPTRVIEGLLA